MKKAQLEMLKKGTHAYGGSLMTRRKFRQMARPISTKHSMHFVMRSTQARGQWSFLRHKTRIKQILEQAAERNGVILKSTANVGNHLHIHLQLTHRQTYKAFIRAITAAIMMAVTGASRWQTWESLRPTAKKFWDLRPFSRIIIGFRAALRLADYVAINDLETKGFGRDQARFMIEWDRGKYRRCERQKRFVTFGFLTIK